MQAVSIKHIRYIWSTVWSKVYSWGHIEIVTIKCIPKRQMNYHTKHNRKKLSKWEGSRIKEANSDVQIAVPQPLILLSLVLTPRTSQWFLICNEGERLKALRPNAGTKALKPDIPENLLDLILLEIQDSIAYFDQLKNLRQNQDNVEPKDPDSRYIWKKHANPVPRCQTTQ